MTSLALVPAPPAPPAQLARAVIAQHSKSFALASRLLPEPSRDEAAVLYAWCRRVDDAVDGAPAAAERVDDAVDGAPATADRVDDAVDGAPAAADRVDDALDGAPATAGVLARLRDELDRAYAGDTTDPLLAAFGHLARLRHIPRAYPDALLDGMAMDLAGTRYRTIDDLFGYAWRVAGVVGTMMTHVLGIADDDALVPAAHLGIAMQLTNVCRDVAEDWQRGRLYIPDELLGDARGLADALGSPLPASAVPALATAVRELLALADRYYRSADRGLVALPWRAALAVGSARDVYAAIGARIARTQHDVTAGRAIVPRHEKLARVALAAVRIAASAPDRLAPRTFGIPSRTLELADVPRV